jgi:hypothetical protein
VALFRGHDAGGDRVTDGPIDDYLDELLRRTRADARTTRRLLDESADHLHASAAELLATGMAPDDAEREAVRRFGSAASVAGPATRHALGALVLETLRAAAFLAGWGLVAVGISGIVALGMNVVFGRDLVGGVSVGPFGSGQVTETADDAVVLRVLAGLCGVLLLLVHHLIARRRSGGTLLPAGLIDALGGAAFAAATVVLVALTAQQAARTGIAGVGFPLSGALVAFPAAVWFCVRSVRGLLPSR